MEIYHANPVVALLCVMGSYCAKYVTALLCVMHCPLCNGEYPIKPVVAQLCVMEELPHKTHCCPRVCVCVCMCMCVCYGKLPWQTCCYTCRLFSIDPPTARDLDDALSIQQLPGGNFRVGVHIADVAHFIR